MDSQPIKVLLIEDDNDYLRTREMLDEIGSGRFELEWVQSYTAGLEAIRLGKHDVYLVDYRLQAHTGLELLQAARAQDCHGPIILLTAHGDREIDVQAMKAGAADYLTKGRIDAPLLERSIRHALERHRAAEALRQAHDTLERRVHERTLELSQANALLADADRRKDEFLAMLAHELRNPLAPIASAIQLLRARGLGDEELNQSCEVLDRQVQQLTRLVDDLLEVARSWRSKISLRKETVDLSTVIARAVETSQPILSARKQKLSVHLPPQPLRLDADVTRLAQVFANLLNNAAKFTDEGGQITISAETAGDSVRVRVIDTGIGIAPSALPRLFELFSQANSALDRTYGGLGVGLSVVRRLVQMHGGQVEAHSAGPGKGSEFVVCLPLAASTTPAKAAEGPCLPGELPSRRILVVDDNIDTAAMLAQLLKYRGQDVQTANSGPAAIDAAQSHEPEIVLLDIGLPGLNGYEVARRLRQLPATAGSVLCALTGYGQEEDRRRSGEAGFDYHFVKPVTLKLLEKLLTNREMLQEFAVAASSE